MTGKGELFVAWGTIYAFCNEQEDCKHCLIRDSCFNELTGGRNLSEVARKFLEEVMK